LQERHRSGAARFQLSGSAFGSHKPNHAIAQIKYPLFMRDSISTAFELLISHTDPNNPDTSGDGMLDGWKVLWGLNALTNNPAQPGLRLNYSYYAGGWLQVVTGIRSGSVTLDAEGNVQQVSQ